MGAGILRPSGSTTGGSALSPNRERFDVVSVNLARGTAHRLGTIDTADCDWSPDRQIVYAMPPTGRVNSSDEPTTLRTLDTHLPAEVKSR